VAPEAGSWACARMGGVAPTGITGELAAMQRTETTSADSAAGMTGSAADWRVVDVQPRPGFQLQVTFRDGTSGLVDLRGFLASAAVAGTVFESLRDEWFFRRVALERGALRWPNGVDFAPDAMYDAIRRTGTWVVDG
jgi:hypothetical protein